MRTIDYLLAAAIAPHVFEEIELSPRPHAATNRTDEIHDSIEIAIRRSILRQFPARLLAELQEDAVRVQIPAGSELYREHDEPRSSLVVSGLVRVYVINPAGRDLSVRYARPGDMIGIAAIYGGPAPVNVRMMTDATLLMLNTSRLTRMAMTTPAVGWALAEEITRRFYDALELLGGGSPGSTRQLVARYLLETASEQRGQTVMSPVTRQELVSVTGAAPPVITRILRDLRTKGLIGTGARGFLMLDPEGLYLEALSPGE